MQCYQYLAIQRFARRHLGEWTRNYDDLELAEALDDRDGSEFRRVVRNARRDNGASAAG